MPKLYKEIIKIAVLGGLLVVVQAFAFTEPSAAPPGNNAPAPLNVGGDAQTKLGGLILNTGGAPNGLSVPLGNVGIGTLSPQVKLDVEGKIKIKDGTQGEGKVLTSDTNGISRWDNPKGFGGMWVGGLNVNPYTGDGTCPAGYTKFYEGEVLFAVKDGGVVCQNSSDIPPCPVYVCMAP